MKKHNDIKEKSGRKHTKKKLQREKEGKRKSDNVDMRNESGGMRNGKGSSMILKSNFHYLLIKSNFDLFVNIY
jgi:hypothetical protein